MDETMINQVDSGCVKKSLPATKPFILTNHPGRDKSKTWAECSDEFIPLKKKNGVWNDFYRAWGLFRRRTGYQVVVLGGGARSDLIYLVLQSFWPFSVKPVIKIDCLWYLSSPFNHFFKKQLFRFLDRVITRYVVWASREIKAYADAFQLPEGKFCFIPYHTTIDPNKVKVLNKNYLFSGGNFARDYATLAKAVDGLDVEVIIACTNQDALEGIIFPHNIQVVGVNHQKFMRLLAESHINVVPLQKGLLHSGGQQTFLNAMLLKKPVIVTDPEGAKDYIDDGRTGFLVSPGDPVSLRIAIARLLEDKKLAESMAKKSAVKAKCLNTEANLASITSLAAEIIENQHAVNGIRDV